MVQPGEVNCPYCGSAIAGGSKFCPSCGAPQVPVAPAARYCPSCGAPNSATSSFCQRCGANFQAPWTPAYPQAPAGGPGTYQPYSQKSGGRSVAVILVVIVIVALILAVVVIGGLLMTSSNDAAGTGDGDFTWTYQGRSYAIDLDISKAAYEQYRSDTTQRYAYTLEEAVEMCDTFVTPDESVILRYAAALSNYTQDLSDLQTANLILSFVQNIEYMEDEISISEDEYWRFPVETLYDEQGDCEDKAFLYASLMEALGYDAVILLFDGHAAAGIEIDGAYGTYYETDGSDYFYCETTAVGWAVGDIPDEYGSAYVSQVS